MEVLMLIGRYAGEIRDIKPIYAHELIHRGDALDPNAPIAPRVDTVAAPAVIAATQPAKAVVKAVSRRAGSL